MVIKTSKARTTMTKLAKKMSTNSIFSSWTSEKRWVLEVDKNFPQQEIVDIDFDTPTSIFRVPKTMSETRQEAYVPQHLGFGPYHHCRPELYLMQKPKLAAVRSFLNQRNTHSFQQVVQALIQCETVIRACYDEYIDLDIETVARILAIDSLVLLHFLENYAAKGGGDADIEQLTGDIFMLENQVPKMVVEKVMQVIQFNQGEYEQLVDVFLKQSPLKLSEVVEERNELHLLHRMYFLIVNNRGLKRVQPSKMTRIGISDVGVVVDFLENQGVPGAGPAGQILSFMENVPWEKILGLFKKGGPKEPDPNVHEIDIPSVSEMAEAAGIEFTLTHGGIRDIMFIELEKEKRFCLPVISLDPNSEIILRNLVAFEAVSAKPGTTHEFTEYLDLMCGIIDTKKDVDILRKAKIIEGDLPNEEIVRIFNGIKKSTGTKNPESNIEYAIDAGKKQYGNVFSVKALRFVGSFGFGFLMSMKGLFYVLILVMLTAQAYCSVFGCSRWNGKSYMVRTRGNILYADQ